MRLKAKLLFLPRLTISASATLYNKLIFTVRIIIMIIWKLIGSKLVIRIIRCCIRRNDGYCGQRNSCSQILEIIHFSDLKSMIVVILGSYCDYFRMVKYIRRINGLSQPMRWRFDVQLRQKGLWKFMRKKNIEVLTFGENSFFSHLLFCYK